MQYLDIFSDGTETKESSVWGPKVVYGYYANKLGVPLANDNWSTKKC
jgi:hypothetical protein